MEIQETENGKHYNTQEDTQKEMIINSEITPDDIKYSVLYQESSKLVGKKHSPILTSFRYKNQRYT